MSDPSKKADSKSGSGGGGSKKATPPSQKAEKFFGSEVDLKAPVINPPQKLAEGEKMPSPPTIKTVKDATDVQELEEKLKTIQKPANGGTKKSEVGSGPIKDSAKDVGAKAKDQAISRAMDSGLTSKKTSKMEVK